MKADTKANTLSFVVSSGPKLQNDPGVRSLIRQHAMRNVATTRKKRANYGRVNTLQMPVLTTSTNIPIRETVSPTSIHSPSARQLTGSDNSESSTDIDLVEHDDMLPWQLACSIQEHFVMGLATSSLSRRPAKTPLSEYESARCRFQVDVTDLSMLTSFSVGGATQAALSNEPARLLTLLGHSNWSYLQFVPSRYGTSACLTTATDCLLEKTRGVLIPSTQDRRIELRLHSRALKTLQSALQDTSACMSSDVLCATQLLSLYELLDCSGITTWDDHIKGSVSLVKHRTAARFTSDFDKALFAGHIGPVVFKSLTTDKRCYFEDPQWIDLYQSTAHQSESLTDRSPLAIRIRTQMFRLPGLWHDIGNAIKGPDLFDDAIISKLQLRCLKAHGDLLDWTADYNAHCMRLALTCPSSQELAMRRELFGVALECLAVTKRLLATVCDNEREGLETEVQVVAQLILDLQRQPSPKHSWLFSGHEVGVAQTIFSTREQWEHPPAYSSVREMRLAARERYTAWSSMLRANA